MHVTQRKLEYVIVKKHSGTRSINDAYRHFFIYQMKVEQETLIVEKETPIVHQNISQFAKYVR